MVVNLWDEYRLINGIQEYILHYPCIAGTEVEKESGKKPEEADVILVVGDSGCDTAFGYLWAPILRRAFHSVIYDMRGNGRTGGAEEEYEREHYYSLAYQDLVETVAYVREYYKRDRIVLCGHGYASALTAQYVSAHPEHILMYIGAGQCTRPKNYEKARCRAMELVFNMKGRMKNVLFMSQVHSESGGTYQLELLSLRTRMKLQTLQKGIGMSDANVRRSMRIAAKKSPLYQDRKDKAIIDRAEKVRKLLTDCLEIQEFCLEDYPFADEVHTVLISGRHDFVHPYVLVKEYWTELYGGNEEKRTNVILELVEGQNANMMYDDPVTFWALVWRHYMQLMRREPGSQ